MSDIDQKQQAIRLLTGLEAGGMSAAEAAVIAETLDPVLIYCIIRYLREAYPISDPAASGVLERVVTLTSKNSAIVGKSKEGERDPISRWFAQDYSFREFKGRSSEMIEILVDKLEG